MTLASGAHAQTAATAQGAAVEAVVVTGSRLATAGFQAPTPVTIVGAQQIAQSGASTIIDVVNEMPAFRNTTSPSNTTFGLRTAGQANVDLRGLGVARTLVLINGLRHVPVTAAGAVDTNHIPSSLVDRIEVVTGGASAAYGSDAVAGVVNFVLKNRMEGFTSNAMYGVSRYGDNIDKQLSVGYGKSFAGDKGHFIIGGEYASNGGTGYLFKGPRAWGNKEPGILTLAATRAAGLPSQVVSNYVESSAQCFGGYITNTVLKGTCFNDGGQPFILPQGELVGPSLMISTKQVNRNANIYPTQVIRGAFERTASMSRVEYEVTPDTTIFAGATYATLTDNTGGTVTSPTIVILRNNPFLPAATLNAMVANNIQSFSLNILGGGGLDGLGYNPIHASEAHNPVKAIEAQVGAKGKIFGDWDWDVGFVSGKVQATRTADYYWNQANWYASLYAVPDANGTAICGPTATNPNFAQFDAIVKTYVQAGCLPWNPFGGKKVDPAAVRYAFGKSYSNEQQTQSSAAINLTGEPFMLPAGAVSLATGVEWRKTSFNAEAGYESKPFYLVNENNISYEGAVDVKEAFVEVGAPLLRDVTLFKSLDLNGAARRTNYSTSGSVTTWKIGGTWDLNDWMRFRTTKSRDIRAPNIAELFNKGSQGRSNLTNKVTGVTAIAYGFSVGNSNLQPEIADTFTAGVVFQPKWNLLNGFRASVDYYKIKISGVIGTVASQDVIDRCLLQKITSYCSQIDFDPNNTLGFTGVHSQSQNQNKQYTDGVDIETSYRVPIETLNLPGSFNVRVLGSWVDDLATVAQGVDLDSAGQAVPKWTWTGNLDYKLNRFSIGVQARYKSPIKYSLTLIGPNDPTYSSVASNSISDNLWPGIVYINLNSSYDVISDGGKRVQIYTIIDNLMDKDPPLIAASLQSGGNPYDLIGRDFKVGVRVAF